MTEMSGRHYQQQPRHGHQPPPDERYQGYPDQQPWADPQQPQQQSPQQPQQHYGYAPPQQHPQQGYPQQAYPQQGHPQRPAYQPGPNPTNELQCRFCGSYPAKEATIRGHRGIIVVMQFLKQEGPFCRDCGISTVRTMSANTMVQGWWSYISFIITPITLLINLFQRLKFKDIPAPRPAPDGNSVAPMPLGKPLFLRPVAMIFLLVPIIAISWVVFNLTSAGSERYVGQCVKAASDRSIDFVSCDKPNDGQVISVVDNANQCSAEATSAVERVSRSRTGRETTLEVLCVK